MAVTKQLFAAQGEKVAVFRDHDGGVWLSVTGYCIVYDAENVPVSVHLEPETVRLLGLALNLATSERDEGQAC